MMNAKKNVLYINLLLISFLFIGLTTPVFAADSKIIEQDYYFETDNPSDLHYDIVRELEVDGSRYRLKDEIYDIFSDPITEDKSFKGNVKKADEYLTMNIEGAEIKLYASENIKWKDDNVTYKQEYASEEEIEKSVFQNGKKLVLKSVNAEYKIENVSTTAAFYSDSPDTTEYIFNNKTVNLVGGDPVWDGWRDDYAAYLGILGSSVYSITGTSWQSAPIVRDDGSFVRYASVYGTKQITSYIATYELSQEEDRYSATVTYKSKYIGHVHVVYEKYITAKQKIVYAATGISVLALASAIILLILSKRREKEEE